MGRIARVVVPGLPHHVTQRGNRRLPTFFQDDDYRLYLDLLAEECRRHAVEIWAYSLMPNHSHLVPIPSTEAGLAAAIGETHRRYTLAVNRSMGWTGHLWQGRFASYPLESDYLRNVIRYVETQRRARRPDRISLGLPLLQRRRPRAGQVCPDYISMRGYDLNGNPLPNNLLVPLGGGELNHRVE